MNWQGIDLRWAYGDLLLSLSRQTRCVQRAQDVLHDALLRFAMSSHAQPLERPNAYLRRVAHTPSSATSTCPPPAGRRSMP